MKINFEFLKKTQIENSGNEKPNKPIKKFQWIASSTEQIMLKTDSGMEERVKQLDHLVKVKERSKRL